VIDGRDILRGTAVALTVCVVGATTPAAPGDAGPAPPRFVDVAKESGIDYVNRCGAPPGQKGWLMEGMGAGAAWLDYDGDGKLDLYLVNGSIGERGKHEGQSNRLYRGDGEGRFQEVTDKAGVGDRGWGYGTAVGDVDNDGDPDLFVANYGPDVLYRNNGDGTFTDVSGSSGIAAGDDWSTSAAFFDMDLDGDLDLYVGRYMADGPGNVPRRASEQADDVTCTYRGISVFCGPLGQTAVQDAVYRNAGDGTFKDVTREAGFLLGEARYTLGVVTADYDNDGDQDVYVANDSVRNSLWRNDGKGHFTDVGVTTLVALNADGRAQAGMGTAFGDYDGDGWLDLAVTNFSYDLNTLYRNLAGRFFVDESAIAGMSVTNMALSWGVGFHDFDLDGALDLFIANGHVYPNIDGYDVGTRFRQRNHLFMNVGKGRFREAGARAGTGLALERSFRGAAFADYDDDGDMDVLLTALDEPATLLRNEGPAAGHHLRVRLSGGRSNRDGVGARVTVVAGQQRWIRERKGGGSYLSASESVLHFGLGSTTRVDRVEVRWPSGTRDVVTGVAVDRVLVIEEGASPP
jgi:hypothetical protein